MNSGNVKQRTGGSSGKLPLRQDRNQLVKLRLPVALGTEGARLVLTPTGNATALLCTKVDGMCLKICLQNSVSLKTFSFQRPLTFISNG